MGLRRNGFSATLLSSTNKRFAHDIQKYQNSTAIAFLGSSLYDYVDVKAEGSIPFSSHDPEDQIKEPRKRP